MRSCAASCRQGRTPHSFDKKVLESGPGHRGWGPRGLLSLVGKREGRGAQTCVEGNARQCEGPGEMRREDGECVLWGELQPEKAGAGGMERGWNRSLNLIEGGFCGEEDPVQGTASVQA